MVESGSGHSTSTRCALRLSARAESAGLRDGCMRRPRANPVSLGYCVGSVMGGAVCCASAGVVASASAHTIHRTITPWPAPRVRPRGAGAGDR